VSVPLSGSAQPRALVPGDADRVESLATQFATIAEGLTAAAATLARIGLDQWQGPAAQAFLATLGMAPGPLRVGGEAFGAAASQARAHAEVLRHAQGMAALAASMAREGESATARWSAAQREREAVRARAVGGDAGAATLLSGLPALGADPGVEVRREAELVLAGARAAVADSASRVRAVLGQGARRAPTEPNVAVRVLTRGLRLQRQVAFGAAESTFELGSLLLHVSPQRGVVNPVGWREDAGGVLEGLGAAAQHPDAFAKSVLDWDTWAKNPARAIGHLAPDAAATVATGGLAAGVRGGSGLARLKALTRGGRLGRSESEAYALPINAFPRSEVVRTFAQRVPPVPGLYDVALHGNPWAVQIDLADGRTIVTRHRTLARFIASRPDYAGEPVRLLSCGTGGLPDGLAQNLANKLGVPVLAPSDRLWITEYGRLFIGPDQFTHSGEWRTFVPGGRR
jgi:hypothetical protein